MAISSTCYRHAVVYFLAGLVFCLGIVVTPYAPSWGLRPLSFEETEKFLLLMLSMWTLGTIFMVAGQALEGRK